MPRTLLIAGACALFTTGEQPFAGPAPQSSTPASTNQSPDTVVILGTRASFESTQKTRREEAQIVDSVVAEDILKLPDINVSDALQRITGIQIVRDRGEGSVVSLRGLTQMEATLNGREIFTAGTGRNLDFADFPAEMVSSIRVYKTSAADQLEGGVGGLIALRTYRPFDFEERQLVASARLIQSDLVDEHEGQYSTLLSDRWSWDRGGELGALVNVSWQKRAWREDQKATGNPTLRSDVIPGLTVTVPNGTSETTSVGHRERLAGSAVLQWRPSTSLDLYAEGSYAEFRTLQDSDQMNVFTANAKPGRAATLFPGTQDVQSVTWANAPLSILSFARDTIDRTKQWAVGGTWTHAPFTLKTDVSYTESFNHLFFSGPFFAGTAPVFSQDLSPNIPTTAITGTDLLNPANFRYTGIAYRTRPFSSALTAARLDGDYDLGSGLLRTLSVGLRDARRTANDTPGLIFADAPLTGVSAAAKPGLVQPNPYNDFFPADGAQSIRSYMVGNLAGARDAAALRALFNITTPIPTTGSPLGIWAIHEETRSAYALARIGDENTRWGGNFGLRVVHTRESVSGSQSVPGTNTTAPLTVDSAYTDYLPSLNLRYSLAPGWQLRLAASKTITRPDFDQLAPSLTLIPNPVNPAQSAGSGGNPQLRPVRARNFDLAVEKYFNDHTSIYLTGFYKRVDGFVSLLSAPEVHGGITYQVSRSQNAHPADIKGFELAYQQFYDFLPGWLSGLGAAINFTYVDSSTRDTLLGADVPLQNLSKRSFNVIGIYEKGRVSARVAYNWRDSFLSSVVNIVGVGALPVYTRPYGWLDASVGYRIGERISVSLEGMNLTRTVRASYYGVGTRPQGAWLNDRQVSLTATARF